MKLAGVYALLVNLFMSYIQIFTRDVKVKDQGIIPLDNPLKKW